MQDASQVPEQDLIETAIALADIARSTTLRYFRQRLDVVRKADSSPVTVADRETELKMRELIESRHPDHGIVGEEFGVRKAKSPFTWIIDPIDGTKSFVSGKPIFGSLIALTDGDSPIVGVIETPCQRERWLGVRGRPTTLNGEPCRVSNTRRLADAVMLSTTPDMFGDEEWSTFQDVSRRARSRAFGTDCYGYGLMASGFTDAVMESDLKPYDYLALIPVVEGSGGVITDWQGSPLSSTSTGQVLASATEELHLEIVRLIAMHGAMDATSDKHGEQ
jgi:histidinol phosphatase-like enzyme (inositol monophosphatase family)